MVGCRKDETIITPIIPPPEYPINHDWLKYIPDSMYITEITIPGTHDAASDFRYLPNGLIYSGITLLCFIGVQIYGWG
jgi:hypothetical protein